MIREDVSLTDPPSRCGREDFSQWLLPAAAATSQQQNGGVRGLATLPSKKALDLPSSGGGVLVCFGSAICISPHVGTAGNCLAPTHCSAPTHHRLDVTPHGQAGGSDEDAELQGLQRELDLMAATQQKKPPGGGEGQDARRPPRAARDLGAARLRRASMEIKDGEGVGQALQSELVRHYRVSWSGIA